MAAQEERLRPQYLHERAAALQVFLLSPEGKRHFDAAYPSLLVLHQRSDPHDPVTAARAYVEEHQFSFPRFEEWSLGLREQAFDVVAFAVEFFVAGTLNLAVALGGNDGLASQVVNDLQHLVTIVTLVGDHLFRPSPSSSGAA